MIRNIIAICFVMLFVNIAYADFCPNDTLVWPTNCVPSYVSPAGNLIPERCATFTPDVTGELSSITISDPTTGYQAPVEVVKAVAVQDDALNVLAVGWAHHKYGTYPDGPRHAYDTARILDYQQLNDFVTAVVNGTRDTGFGTHVVFVGRKPTDAAAATARLCVGAVDYPRCQAAVTTTLTLEVMSLNWGNKYGHSLSYETLSNLFSILVRPPITPTTRCGQ